MYRIESRATQRIIDFGVLSIALWGAFLLRFDGDIPLQYLKRALFQWPYVLILQYITLAFFRVPTFSWRYIGLREVSRILQALSASAALLLSVRLVTGAFFHLASPAGYLFIPVGVILIDYVLAFVGVAGVRGLRRALIERFESGPRRPKRDLTPTLLIGAGRAGLLVAREIERRPELGLDVVGFIDDDPDKRGLTIHGVRVLGSTVEITDVVQDQAVDHAIITIANTSGSAIRRIRERCDRAGLSVKIIPGIYEIIDGRVNLGRIREVSIEDLLRRKVRDLGSERLTEFLGARRVLVTGAGGSIGSEIARQVARYAPHELLLLERAEPALFAIHHELAALYPNLRLVPLLVDIRDAERIEATFQEGAPDVIFHAAAHKHVPMVEWNPGEALKNNIFGTKILADAAARCQVDDFVLISTDKAVNPTSIMGASKRVAEIYVQSLAQQSNTKFVAVRFGNVLGSTGSVVPIFKEQIARGGPVTVTHPDMMRYFMTIPEATALVLQAGAMGTGGEIFVLDMGEPVKILELAVELIRLSGFEPHDEIPIEFSGIRPGEKLFEELGFDSESMKRTAHSKIFGLRSDPEPLERVEAFLRRLRERINVTDPEQIRKALRAIVPEMQTAASAELPAASDEGGAAGSTSAVLPRKATAIREVGGS